MESGAGPVNRPIRVLMVEDSEYDAELITQALHDGGLIVETKLVSTGPTFSALLESFAPDVVLADWSLPGFSGAEAVAMAHEWNATVPCILVSGTLGEELVVQALRTGATDYVLKQRLQALVPAVRRALAEAAEHQARLQLEAELEKSQAAMRDSLDAMSDSFMIFSAIREQAGSISDFRILFANRAAREFLGQAADILVGASMPEPFNRLGDRSYVEVFREVLETGGSWADPAAEVNIPGPDGVNVSRVVDLVIAAYEDGVFAVGRDITEQHRANLQMRKLSTVIEQSAESVVITDPTGAIEYVNPAFERLTGYRGDEVLGRNPRILQSGHQGPAFYAAMWATLTSGRSFTAEFTNRRKDGTLFQEESVISPILDADGAITSYAAVKRDVTRERAFERAEERHRRERALIAATLSEMRALSTPGETAEVICRQVATLSGIASAALVYFVADGPAVPLAFVPSDGKPWPIMATPPQRSRSLRERAEQGPWVEAWERRQWHPYDGLFAELGVSAMAGAPLSFDGRVVGVLLVTSAAEHATAELSESLPALLEVASIAGTILGPAIAALTESSRLHEVIADIISKSAYEMVFQPIVDVTTGRHAGYEALTRFGSGIPPDVVFADARTAGLEEELELATLEAAIKLARGLPKGTWLSLNVSPALLMRSDRLATLLRDADRAVVLEITEHVQVTDYLAIRQTIAGLRPKVRVAVDDAGSGVANFNHIVELKPAFVKLDLTLIRGVDADRTRQALVVGLTHFAEQSHSQTIAEGVETEAELQMLRTLGINLVQGYLLARPAPVTHWSQREGG